MSVDPPLNGEEWVRRTQKQLDLQKRKTAPPVAGSPAAFSHVHDQSTPATTWTITHALPFQPNVTIVDSAGNKIFTTIIYDSATQIRSISSAAFSGSAYLS